MSRFIVGGFITAIFVIKAGAMLDAPVLNYAQAVDTSTIVIHIRNTSFDNEAFVVLRGKEDTTEFQIIDTIASTVTDYTDSNLSDATTYCYRMFSINDTAASDNSNTVCTTTMEIDTTEKDTVLQKPYFSLQLDTQSTVVSLTCSYFSRVADGYRIYRRIAGSDEEKLIGAFTNADTSGGTYIFNDSSLLQDHWYFYKVEAFNETDSVRATSQIFAISPMPEDDTIHFELAGRIPLSTFLGGGGARVVGDTVFVQEYDLINSEKINKISMIGIQDPQNPEYLGPASDSLLFEYSAQYAFMDTFLTNSATSVAKYYGVPAGINTSRYTLAKVYVFAGRIGGCLGTQIRSRSQGSIIDTSDLCSNWIVGDSVFALACDDPTSESKSLNWEIFTISDNGKDFRRCYTLRQSLSVAMTSHEDLRTLENIFFFYPYLFSFGFSNTMLLDVRDIRQLDSSMHVGQIPYREETGSVQSVLFDPDRSLLMIFYPKEMDIYTFDKKLEFNKEEAVSNKISGQHRNKLPTIQGLHTIVAQNRIQVILPDFDGPYSVYMFNLQGRNVSEIRNVSDRIVDLPRVARGVYFLTARSRNTRLSKTVIVR